MSASGNTNSMQMGRLETQLATLQQQLNAANSSLTKVQTCSAQHMFYTPSDPKADGNGCTDEQDPQVDSLTSNGLCTSDGSVVDCKAMQGADIKVFSVTQISSNGVSAIATCPGGTMRVGCAGNRDYAGSCTEGTCGIASITPSGTNGCQINAQGSGIIPAAVALCFSLQGGSDIVQGSAPPPPKACSLPWGGSLSSGSSVAAYASSSVPYGNSCSKQTRTCNNGSLSGSYGYKNCTVQPPANCSATTATWNTYCKGSVAAKSSGGSESVSNTASCYTGSITASCSNGSWSYASGSCSYTCGGGGGGGGCFLGDTYVLMADGTSKLIQNLKVGDLVASAHGTNRVTHLGIHYSHEPIYALNGGKPFITGEHVIFTTTGTKVIDPKRLEAESEYYDHKSIYNSELKQAEKPGKLQVGDIIIMHGGEYLPVTSITSVERKTYKLYNPSLDGDHTYYANGLLVHNLLIKKE